MSSHQTSVRPALLAIFYVVSVMAAGHPWTAAWLGSNWSWLAIILLYGGLTILALGRKPEEPSVRIFSLLGVFVTLTIVLGLHDPVGSGWAALRLRPLIACLVYLTGFAVFLHMAAMIPRRNPALARVPFLIPGSYAAGIVLGLTAYGLLLNSELRFLPWDLDGAVFYWWAARLSYVFGGSAGLVLLTLVARDSAVPVERRQAILIIAGLLPWTLYQAAAPWVLEQSDWSFLIDIVEAAVIALVPITFVISIFGFRLFNLRVAVRRGLIYGFTSLLLAGAFYGILVGAGYLAAATLSIQPALWQQSLLLVLLGVLFRPVAARVTSGVDSLFFVEKLQLRRMLRTLIPDLAGITDTDELAGKLAKQLVGKLELRGAAVMVADDTGQFFRIRAREPEAGAGNCFPEVLTREEVLDLLPSPPRPVRYAACPPAGGEGLGRRRENSADGGPVYLVAVRHRDNVVGLCLLGGTSTGVELDEEDMEQLELLSVQFSTLLENARLFEAARTDPLTRLARRQVFEERHELEAERSRRTGQPYAVGIADIDNFKRVNDTWGHAAGDAVLRAVGAELARCSRRIDLVSRFGGEEFVFLFPATARTEALELAERLRRSVAELRVPIGTEVPLRVTISLGICAVDPAQGATGTPEGLLEAADQALYRAKKTGKNRVESVSAVPAGA